MSLILDGTNGVSDIDGTASTPAIRGTDANTGIFFPAADTIAFAEGGVESMRLDSSGNVGIGTTSPGYKLDVSYTSGTNGISLSNGGSGNDVARWTANYNTGEIAFGQLRAGAGNYFQTFYTVGTERMRIDSSGNLLVGGTSQLGQISCYFNGAAVTGIGLQTSRTSTGSNFMVFNNNAGNIAGFIQHNGTTTVNYSTSSDYRLKENIAPITGALDKVAALKPVTYTWKNTDGEQGEGFIAHELAEVCPLAVSGEKDAVDAEGKPIYQGIDTSFLVATLTAAIQELNAKVEAQAAKIAELEAK